MNNTCYRIFRKVRRILLCCIVVILIAFFYKHYDATEYSVDNEQEYIDRVCNIAGVPALSVAVWDNENEVFLNYHNDDNKIDENSLYELASTSKAFTGSAILQLQNSGLISFDSPVEQYIPEFHPTYRGTLLVSPISYRYCFVWFPGSLVFFIGFMVIIAIYLITRSILCFIKR